MRNNLSKINHNMLPVICAQFFMALSCCLHFFTHTESDLLELSTVKISEGRFENYESTKYQIIIHSYNCTFTLQVTLV